MNAITYARVWLDLHNPWAEARAQRSRADALEQMIRDHATGRTVITGQVIELEDLGDVTDRWFGWVTLSGCTLTGDLHVGPHARFHACDLQAVTVHDAHRSPGVNFVDCFDSTIKAEPVGRTAMRPVTAPPAAPYTISVAVDGADAFTITATDVWEGLEAAAQKVEVDHPRPGAPPVQWNLQQGQIAPGAWDYYAPGWDVIAVVTEAGTND